MNLRFREYVRICAGDDDRSLFGETGARGWRAGSISAEFLTEVRWSDFDTYVNI